MSLNCHCYKAMLWVYCSSWNPRNESNLALNQVISDQISKPQKCIITDINISICYPLASVSVWDEEEEASINHNLWVNWKVELNKQVSHWQLFLRPALSLAALSHCGSFSFQLGGQWGKNFSFTCTWLLLWFTQFLYRVLTFLCFARSAEQAPPCCRPSGSILLDEMLLL